MSPAATLEMPPVNSLTVREVQPVTPAPEPEPEKQPASSATCLEVQPVKSPTAAVSPSELSLKDKAMKIQFELALDHATGIKETLKHANEYFGIEAKGTPNEQASALLKEMGL